MFGFGKKRITEREAARALIRGLLEDVDGSYPSYFQKIEAGELLGRPQRVFPMADDASFSLACAFLTLELITAKNLFREDQARRIVGLSIEEFAMTTGRSKEETLASIDQFEDEYRIFAGKLRLDPTGIAAKVYERMGIQLTNIQGIEEPTQDPLVKVALSTLLVESVGRWKRIKDNFNIIPA